MWGDETMKSVFEKPSFEVVRFHGTVLALSGNCGCYYADVDFGTDDTCTGANVSCGCNPNYDDPSANCSDS